MSEDVKKDAVKLLEWYRENFRELPWRESRDAYRIWISEVMLQQTTVTAVKPYFERFLNRFPTLEKLARAQVEDVLEMWSGLGYYSRARNLHKAAKTLAKTGFSKSYKELIQLSGFGPYTARAVSSFAFSEPVGVLDGNVIRFLSRFHKQRLEWWRPTEREKLQKLADIWVQGFDSHDINQALIEIGATICVAQNPRCLTCPLMKSCSSVGTKDIDDLPLIKARKKNEFWVWKVDIYSKNGEFALIKNIKQKNSLPVLKNAWIWPGTATRVKSPPQTFDFKHAVTHHNIYVSILTKKSKPKGKDIKWLKPADIKKISPTSLVNKAFLYF